ncbi:MAG: sodium:solute symporter family protein [Bacteroidota bacterium]
MHLNFLDWASIALYVLISLGIGLYYRKQAGKDLASFFLGGRKLPWFLAGISMVATTFAADTPLAVTELINKNGISGNWLWWNMLIGGMLTTFFFARLWRRANVLTELEFIELRYGGKRAAFLRGFKAIYLGIFINTLIISWVNIALMAIIKVMFGIPDDQLIWYVGLAMLIAATYSSLSGLLGVAVTDALQFVIAIAGSIVLAVLVVNSAEIGGLTGLKEQLPAWSLDFFPSIGTNGASAGKALSITLGSFLAYIGIQWWASWYPGAEPGGGGYVAQRMMSTKDEKHAIKATLFFQIAHYAIRPWPWILVALSTVILYPQLGAGEEKLGYVMAIRDFMPPGLTGLLLVALLAAYMSTISTQLNWGASFIVNDLYKRFFRKDQADSRQEDRRLVFAGRITTLIIMVVALYITTLVENITDVWIFLLECGAGLGLVLILRWYWWRINAWSEISATLVPFGAYAVAKYSLAWQFPNSFFFTVGITTISWLVITYLTSPTPQNQLIQFCRQVRPLGAWKPIYQYASIERPTEKMRYLFANWISSVVFTYAVLFFTGKLLFLEFQAAAIWFAIALIAGTILNWGLKKQTY